MQHNLEVFGRTCLLEVTVRPSVRLSFTSFICFSCQWQNTQILGSSPQWCHRGIWDRFSPQLVLVPFQICRRSSNASVLTGSCEQTVCLFHCLFIFFVEVSGDCIWCCLDVIYRQKKRRHSLVQKKSPIEKRQGNKRLSSTASFIKDDLLCKYISSSKQVPEEPDQKEKKAKTPASESDTFIAALHRFWHE